MSLDSPRERDRDRDRRDRDRSSSIFGRRRLSSVADSELGNDDNAFAGLPDIKVLSSFQTLSREFWTFIRPKLVSCAITLVAQFTLMTLLVNSGDRELYGLSPEQWYKFFFVLAGIFLLATLGDNLLFFGLEKSSRIPYNILSTFRCINGPLGGITTILVYDAQKRNDPVPSSIPKWRAIVTLVITILVLQALKNFFQIHSYLQSLEERFNDRISQLEAYMIILSRLASYTKAKHRVSSQEKANATNAASVIAGNDGMQERQKTVMVQGSEPFSVLSTTESAMSGLHQEVAEEAAEKAAKEMAMQKLRDNSLFKDVVQRYSIVDIFKDIVTASQENIEEEAVQEEIDLLTKQHKTFWMRMASMHTGSLKISTCNGILLIYKRVHAKTFGTKLHTHLSRHNRKKITEEMVEEIIRESDIFRTPDENVENIVAHAKVLFQGSYSDIGISCESMVSVCEKVHMERVNLVSSIKTQKELHESLVLVANAIFWVLMVLVAQSFLQIDTTAFLAPLLSIIFGISFALGPIIGNVFLAIGFVLFMLPYDVGDVIYFGATPGSRQLGWIVSVTLLQTQFRTQMNEIVAVPNHILFHERIINLTRSRNGTFEIVVSFAMHGKTAPGMDKINQFMDRITKYVFEIAKADWQDIFITCHTIDNTTNRLGYSLWSTTKHCPGDIRKYWSARRAMLEYMYHLQVELDIQFVNVVQPVDIVSKPRMIGEVDTSNFEKNSSSNSSNINDTNATTSNNVEYHSPFQFGQDTLIK